MAGRSVCGLFKNYKFFYHFTKVNFRNLNLVGGLDLSYSKLNSCIAFCTLVICSTAENNLKVIYEDSVKVNLSTPYIPGDFHDTQVMFKALI